MLSLKLKMIQIPIDNKPAGLWILSLKRLNEIKNDRKKPSRSGREYISYSTAAEKICRNFSINKQFFFEMLSFLREMGFVKLSCGHGILLLYEIKGGKIILKNGK
jgi:hypothetical protein